MMIKVTNKKCFAVSHKASWQKLANHVMSHYPKDVALHKAVKGAFKAFDASAMKLRKSAAKTAKPKRRTAKRTTPKRRTAKRRTAKRATPKRRTARRSAPKRRTAKRRVVRRRRTG